MKDLQLDIITPDKTIYSGKVEKVTVPGIEGSFQVLYNHAALISALADGKVKFKTSEGADQTILTQGGVVEVLKNKVIVLAEKVQLLD